MPSRAWIGMCGVPPVKCPNATWCVCSRMWRCANCLGALDGVKFLDHFGETTALRARVRVSARRARPDVLEAMLRRTLARPDVSRSPRDRALIKAVFGAELESRGLPLGEVTMNEARGELEALEMTGYLRAFEAAAGEGRA